MGQSWYPGIRTHWAIGLEHATIRDNIIFGSRFGHSNDGFDEARYDAVLESCALKRDLAIFEAGDLTGKCLGHVKWDPTTNQPGIRNRGERYYSFRRAKGEGRAGKSIVFPRIRKSNFILCSVGL